MVCLDKLVLAAEQATRVAADAVAIVADHAASEAADAVVNEWAETEADAMAWYASRARIGVLADVWNNTRHAAENVAVTVARLHTRNQA